MSARSPTLEAAVFVANGVEDCREVMGRVQPHFAVIDPSASDGNGPGSLAWELSHPDMRTVVYTADVHTRTGAGPKWLVDKTRPVSDVIDVILGMVEDPSWLDKGGDDIMPRR